MTAIRKVACGMCQQPADGVRWYVRRNGVIVREFTVVQCPRCDVPQHQKPREPQ